MSKSDVTILINNTAAIRKAVTGKQLEKAAMAGGFVIERAAKINVSSTFSGKSTGAAGLGGSIQTVVEKTTAKSSTVNVGPTVIYGRIQELGGVVLPVFAKMLSWVSDSGERIFANKVQIPARPYLRPAVDNNKDDIVDAISYQLEQQIKKAAS